MLYNLNIHQKGRNVVHKHSFGAVKLLYDVLIC